MCKCVSGGSVCACNGSVRLCVSLCNGDVVMALVDMPSNMFVVRLVT